MLVAGGMMTVSLPAEAAMWGLTRPTTPASIHIGVLGVVGADTDDAAEPTQRQSQGPEAGQSQTQSRQSQTQRSPAPRDDDDDDDAFFDEVYSDEAPAEPEVIEEVIEIEVPEGSVVEYEIYEEGGVRVVRPRIVPAPPAPTPAPVITPAPAPPPAAAPPPAPRPVAAPSPRAAPTVEVAFRSPTHLEIQRFNQATSEWINVCWAPCKARVPKDAILRVGRGGDVPRSRPFMLPEEGRQHAVVIEPGSRRQRSAGIGIAALSSFGLITGAVMVDATARFEDRSRRSYEGYVVLGMAGLTFIAGVAMAASNRTKVREGREGRRLALLPGGFAF